MLIIKSVFDSDFEIKNISPNHREMYFKLI